MSDIELDRDDEVPIGVQLAWALRSRILGGALSPGSRLPALHQLADQLGINANTVRSVYRRLEQAGLVETRHGSGTYVAQRLSAASALPQLLASVADAARGAGVEPRDLAAALYGLPDDLTPSDDESADRRRLRSQIAVLEQLLSELLVRRPDLAPREAPPRRPPEPRLLDVAGLEAQRDLLLRRVADAHASVTGHALPPGEEPASERSPAATASRLRPRTA